MRAFKGVLTLQIKMMRKKRKKLKKKKYIIIMEINKILYNLIKAS